MSCKLLRVLRPKSGIYVVNRSTLVTDEQVRTWTAACARQISEHVAPTYAMDPVRVQVLSAASHAPAGAWVITVLDDADQAGDLGWHTDERGLIYGRVFARPCLDYGVPVSTTLSHELVETFCDPDVDRWVDTGAGYSVPWEACDPVEGDSYEIDGVAVSDFVKPWWYRQGTPPDGATRWVADREVLAPFELAVGGYCVRRFPDGSEDQVFGRAARRGYIAAKAHELGRTSRRRTAAGRRRTR